MLRQAQHERAGGGPVPRGPVCTLSQWAIDNIDAIHGAQGAFDEAGEVAQAA